MKKTPKAIKEILKSHNASKYSYDGLFLQVHDRSKWLIYNYLRQCNGKKYTLFNKVLTKNI